MCGESWCHERSLTHRPSSQGWASAMVSCSFVCVVFVTLMCAFVHLFGVGCQKLSFSSFCIFLCWCAMQMCFHVTSVTCNIISLDSHYLTLPISRDIRITQLFNRNSHDVIMM